MKRSKEKRKKHEKLKPRSTWRESQLTVYECKGIRISYQEHNEMPQWISSWVPVSIKSHTLMKNVSSWFNRIIAVRAFEILIGKESQMIFSNWSMISDGPCSVSTKWVRMTEYLELRSFFSIHRFDDVEVVVY